MMTGRPRSVAILLLLALASLFVAPHAHAQRPPNVLVVVADDLGVDMVGAYAEGKDLPPTPNLDRLAARGVLFRNTWAYPSCSPARAAILTGRYPTRTFVGRWIRHLSNSEPIGTLAADEWTMPEVLDRAGTGHAHAAIGKWHVHDATHGPDAPRTLGGFAHHAGSLEGQIPDYYNWTRVVDGKSAATSAYTTTQNVDDALAFIGKQSGPWFCYLAFQAPHIPFHRPPAALHTQNLNGLVLKPLTKEPSQRPFYKAMIEAMDTEFGRLLAGIGSAELARTHIVFVGDNGSVQNQAVAPFVRNRAKGTPYEGGVNVPLIVAGPAVTSGGREVTALTCAVDVFATALELAGAADAVPEHVVLDSVSLVPYLRYANQAPLRRFAFTEEFTGDVWPQPNTNGHATVRDARYKLIHRYGGKHEFFDLQVDPFETRDLLGTGMSSQERAAYAALLNEIANVRTPLARLVPFGSGACRGTAGVPTLGGSGTPRLGASYTVQLAGAGAARPSTLLVGVSMERWGALPLPFDLGVVGAGAGCTVWNSGEVALGRTTQADGSAAVTLAVPYALPLVGETLFHHWLVVDPTANGLGLVTTTASAAVLGL